MGPWLLLLLLQLAVAAPEASDPPEAAVLQTAWDEATAAAAHTDALRIATEQLALRTEALGPTHVLLAESLDNLGASALALGDPEAAARHHLDAIRMREEAGAGGALRMAVSLVLLAEVYRRGGEPARAVPLYERALAIRTTQLPPDDVRIAIVHNNLGLALESAGDLDGALAHYAASLEVYRAAEGPLTNSVARAMHNLAAVSEQQGRLDAAAAHLTACLEVRDAALRRGHPEANHARRDLIRVQRRRGRPRLAIPVAERLVADLGAADEPDLAELSNAVNLLAIVQGLAGNHVASRDAMRRSLAIDQQRFSAPHPDLAKALGNLAWAERNLGNTAAARPLLEQALAMERAVRPPGHPRIASRMSNLATVLGDLGDRAQALALHEEALAMMDAADGVDPDAHASAMNNLAVALQGTEEHARARALLERAVALREDELGPDHPDVAHHLLNLASGLALAGQAEEARPIYARAGHILEATLGVEHPKMAALWHSMAQLELSAGRIAVARGWAEQALALRSRMLPEDHPELADTLDLMALLCARDGDAPEARAHIDRSLAIRTARLELLDVLSEREALGLQHALRRTLNRWLLLHDDPGEAELAWTTLLRWKGIVARRVRHRRDATLEEDPTARATREALDAARRELARLVFAPVAPEEAAARHGRIATLRLEAEALERALAAATPAPARPSDTADARAVCGALPHDTAIVDLIRTDSAYVVFTATAPDCAVRRLALPDPGPLDAAVAAWRDTLANPAASPVRAEHRARSVAGALLDPLADTLASAQRLVFVPDAGLAHVPFAALPLGDGTYLIEHYTLHVLTDATDVLRAAPTGGNGLLAVGDVDFGAAGPHHAGPASETRRAAPCVPDRFPALPGTRDEVGRLGQTWRRGRFRREAAQILTGQEPSETLLVEQLSGHRIVHLATHGFFAREGCGEVASDDAGPGLDPMLLSGVVLAGVDDRDQDTADDGVLTAEELGMLDLRGTELVVLSACETALGETPSGEGVLGLQRGLSIAGVDQLIMSLWPISDAGTVELVDAFYRHLLHRRHPMAPAEALRAAQLEILATARRDAGHASPARWAGLTALGPPRP